MVLSRPAVFVQSVCCFVAVLGLLPPAACHGPQWKGQEPSPLLSLQILQVKDRIFLELGPYYKNTTQDTRFYMVLLLLGWLNS